MGSLTTTALELNQTKHLYLQPMFSRLSQLARHFSRPLPNYAHNSAAALSSKTSRIMTSSSAAAATADERNSRMIHTAACLIIGDEVLGGKTVDTNSAYMAKFCFQLGMALKRIEVIADDEDEIVEAVKRMSTNYDFVVTSGGIGPTHDDITYQSIAKAFSLPLILHDEAYAKMKKFSKPHPSQPLLGRTLCRPNRQTPHDRAPHRHLPAPFQTSALPRLRPLGPRSLHQRKRTRLTWRASTFREIIGWHEAVVG